ncbi:MAG: hypothetical protein ACLQDC_09900, partial [Verrucomicrobiia bacterium]
MTAKTDRLFQVSPAEYDAVYIGSEGSELVPHTTQGAELVYVAALNCATGLNHVGLGGQLAELLVVELR